MNTPFKYELLPPAYACRACGSTLHQHVFGRERFLGTGQRLVLCGQCNLAYLDPDFTPQSLQAFYQHHYRRVSLIDATTRHDEAFFRRVMNREFARARLAVMLDTIPQHGRLLEIGSGFGAFLGEAHRLRPDIALYATESDEAHRHLLLAGAPVTFLQDEAIADQEGFDAVVLIHALEHLPQPVEALRRYATWLRPTGCVFVEVPDRDVDWGSWLYVQPAHLSYFNAAALQRTFLRAGLAVEYVGSHPAGEVLAGTLWVKAVLTTDVPAPEVATDSEVQATMQHIRQYRWNIRQAFRHALRGMALWVFGEQQVGRVVRWRYWRANRRFF